MHYDKLLISPTALARALDDGDVTVLDCRFALADPTWGGRAYEAEHIPGAHFVDLDRDLSSPVATHGGRHPLPDAGSFATRMRDLGLRQDHIAVVYDDSRMAFAARAFWLLRYLGHLDVRVLDGGFAGWKAAGQDATPATPQGAVPGDFAARPDPSLVATRDDLLALNRAERTRIPLIDARLPPRYRGEEEPIDPVAGHIPGAVCVPWQGFTFPDGRAIPEQENRERWSWLPNNATPIVYCGSGVTACVNVLSLLAAGHERTRLYAGSWSDWCSYPDAAVETG
ncbi:MAG: sulfurtransferase [Myxococcales bacterium]|nr:sulfurtransferase [Myxococcales bacterium]